MTILYLLFMGKPAKGRDFEGAKCGHKNYFRKNNRVCSLTLIFYGCMYPLGYFLL